MRVVRVLASRDGGPFARSIRALAKTLPNCQHDVDEALRALTAAPFVPFGKTATLVPGIGCLLLKYRVASTDLQKGRSGSIRVLLAHVSNEQWRCIIAYAKTDVGNLERSVILRAIREEG